MPTGYTAQLAQGEVSFQEFVWRCARAMGALVMMRDEPLDAPIERAEPSPYHRDRIVKSREQLDAARAWSDDEAEALATSEYEKAVASADARRASGKGTTERYAAMLKRVMEWEPPTEKHENFREFMINQLTQSIDFDCYHTVETPKRRTGAEYRVFTIDAATQAIAYHKKNYNEEVARTAERNAWIDALRASVGEPPTNRLTVEQTD